MIKWYKKRIPKGWRRLQLILVPFTYGISFLFMHFAKSPRGGKIKSYGTRGTYNTYDWGDIIIVWLALTIMILVVIPLVIISYKWVSEGFRNEK